METSFNKPVSYLGKDLYIPGMDYAGTRLISSVFKSFGVNAIPCVYPDSTTLELGAKYTSGEECLPEKITIGEFMKVVLNPNFDASKAAFFMPLSNGPCRFGQYAPYFRLVLNNMGFNHVDVCSPTCEDGYAGLADDSNSLMLKAWISLVSADIIRRMLHKVRPYEKMKGTSDKVFERAIERCEHILSQKNTSFISSYRNLKIALKDIRYEFISIPCDFSKPRPLIGVVGEIYCRLDTFANNDIIRNLEELGAEAWLSDISEWIWYSNWEEKRNIRYGHSNYSITMLTAKFKHSIQHYLEKSLYSIFKKEFYGYEEAKSIDEILEYANPYLNKDTSLGEMVLNAGKAIYLYNKGADGIIDLSPFSCMNGIISEAVYPSLSKDFNDFPIKSVYVDGSANKAMERDLPIFIELVKSYQSKKTIKRAYPWYFKIH